MLFSCKENKKRTEAEKIVSEWTGKEIKFPSGAQCCILGNDTASALCTDLLRKEYKVLLYVDSTGCSGCRLKLFQWKQLIAEADSLFNGKLGFVFFFQPKSKKEMSFLFKRDKFDYPVYIDMNNTINRMNEFPQSMNYQCFLIDKDNKVLMIGNPMINPKIWELYKKQVSGSKEEKELPLTSVKLDKINHDYGSIRKGSKNETEFLLENTGLQVLVISRVNASCGCTNVDWDKQPIEPGETTKINLEMRPDETGHFNKTIEVFGNMEQSPVKLTITGIVTE
jgi:hypothetical protein